MKEESDLLDKLTQEIYMNKKISEIISYDGYALNWFFKHLILFDSFSFIKSNSTKKHILTNFVKRKTLKYNELSKFFLTKCNLNNVIPNKNKGNVTKNNIFFLVHSNALLNKNNYLEVDRINDLIKEVDKDPKVNPFLSIVLPLSSKPSKILLQSNNLVYKNIDYQILKKAKSESEKLHGMWNLIKKEIFSRNKKYSQKKNLLNFVFSKEFIFLIILYYETYKKIFQHNNIKAAVFYSYSGLFIRCAIAAANKLEIPTYTTQHAIGMYYGNPDALKTKFFVIGNKYKEILSSQGVKNKDIDVIGPLFLNSLKKKIISSNKFEGILVLTNTFVENNMIPKEEYFLFINSLIKSLKPLNRIINFKLHPREKYVSVYKKLLLDNKVKGKVFLGNNKQELYELISQSELVIGFLSTAVFESVLLNKPVIQINLRDSKKDLFTPVVSDKLVITHISRKDDLLSVVKYKLKNKTSDRDKKRFIKEYIFKLDFKAQERALNCIKEDLKL